MSEFDVQLGNARDDEAGTTSIGALRGWTTAIRSSWLRGAWSSIPGKASTATKITVSPSLCEGVNIGAVAVITSKTLSHALARLR